MNHLAYAWSLQMFDITIHDYTFKARRFMVASFFKFCFYIYGGRGVFRCKVSLWAMRLFYSLQAHQPEAQETPWTFALVSAAFFAGLF